MRANEWGKAVLRDAPEVPSVGWPYEAAYLCSTVPDRDRPHLPLGACGPVGAEPQPRRGTRWKVGRLADCPEGEDSDATHSSCSRRPASTTD